MMYILWGSMIVAAGLFMLAMPTPQSLSLEGKATVGRYAVNV